MVDLLQILITRVITKLILDIARPKLLYPLLGLDQSLNLDLESGTPLSKSYESLFVEIWKSISDDPRYFNKQRSTMSSLLC